MFVRKLFGVSVVLFLCAMGMTANADICNGPGCSGDGRFDRRGSGGARPATSKFGVLSISNGYPVVGQFPGPSQGVGGQGQQQSGTFEGGSCAFDVHRDGKANKPVSVAWKTKDGTATVGEGDYIAAEGIVQMEPGQRDAEGQIVVHTNLDESSDDGEYFFVILKPRSTRADVEDHKGRCTIHED